MKQFFINILITSVFAVLFFGAAIIFTLLLTMVFPQVSPVGVLNPLILRCVFIAAGIILAVLVYKKLKNKFCSIWGFFLVSYFLFYIFR